MPEPVLPDPEIPPFSDPTGPVGDPPITDVPPPDYEAGASMKLLRAVGAVTETGATAVWVGAAAGFAFVAGPVNFHTIDDRNVIASLTQASLDKIARWIYFGAGIAGTIAVLRSRSTAGGSANDIARAVAAFAAIAAIAYHQRTIVPAMTTLQSEIGRFDETPEDDPRRVAYRALHKRSTQWYGGALLMGLTQLALASTRDVATAS